MTGARPGWYPDPAGDQGRFRWWDGVSWTEALTGTPDAPAPAAARPVDAATDTTTTGAVDAGAAAHGVRIGGEVGRQRMAWTVGLALVAVAGMVLGLVIWHDPGRSTARMAPGSTPRPSSSGVSGELDRSTRRATIGDASMTLPGDPYDLRADPMRVTDLFDSYFAAGAIVHDDYRGGRDWSAVVGLAHVSPAAGRGDLGATTSAVAHGIAARFFADQPTTVEELSVADHAIDGCSAMLATARVTYHITGLASQADELTVLVIRLDDGTRVAAFSSVPTDAPESVRRQATVALQSVRAG